MIEQNLVHEDIIKNKKSKYFAHYKTEKENNELNGEPFEDTFIDNYKKLSENDFELHKKLIEEGHNPDKIAKIIRNDEIEKLQEISSQNNFDFNQFIEPSLYERFSFINVKNVSLIDYAAFFSSIKCFKYLLMNGAILNNAGKYAIASGNIEIIHLCEQNHSSFEDAYETAIEFHRNDIFKYLYENKIAEINNLEEFGEKCILYCNYEILLFLIEEGMEINDDIIKEAAEIGNIFLIKYFLQENHVPKNILVFSAKSENFECFKYILRKDISDINAKDIYLFCLIFVLITFYFKIIYGNYFEHLIQHL